MMFECGSCSNKKLAGMISWMMDAAAIVTVGAGHEVENEIENEKLKPQVECRVMMPTK